jgi:hypothetical protein
MTTVILSTWPNAYPTCALPKIGGKLGQTFASVPLVKQGQLVARSRVCRVHGSITFKRRGLVNQQVPLMDAIRVYAVGVAFDGVCYLP